MNYNQHPISTVLSELVRDNESTDVNDWPERDVRSAVRALFQADEKFDAYPSWIGDCLSETLMDKAVREEIIAAFGVNIGDGERLARLGRIMERALTTFPVDTLTETCEQYGPEWAAADRQDAADHERESREEQRMLDSYGDAPCIGKEG
jgi:hypothetical protein